MSLQYLLSSVIRETFLKEVGKNQIRRQRRDGLTIPEFKQGVGNGEALKLRFKTGTDYSKEEGYRWVEVVIYAPLNYVQVWVRTSWNVIPLEDLEDDGDGDTFVKKGKDYNEGESAWEKIADHDSCWTDGVDRVLKGEFGDLMTFDGRGSFDALGSSINDSTWYEIIDVSTVKIHEAE